MATEGIEREAPAERTFYERMLDNIERLGNRVPHPAMIFVWLIVFVIAASMILHWAGVKSTYEVASPPAEQVQERYDGDRSTPLMTSRASSSLPARTRSTRRPRGLRVS